MPKARRTIPEGDVDMIFDGACIQDLAKCSRLPNDADLVKFGENIRQDVRVYARSAREPSDNELHAEIKALHNASDKSLFERTAGMIENLSPRARAALIGRWEQANPSIEFPQPNDLKDIDYREVACAKIASLCRIGVKVAEGRARPSGKRSKTWQVAYYGEDPAFP